MLPGDRTHKSAYCQRRRVGGDRAAQSFAVDPVCGAGIVSHLLKPSKATNYLLEHLRKTVVDGGVVTWFGRLFQTLAAATAKGLSPTVDSSHQVMTSLGDDNDRGVVEVVGSECHVTDNWVQGDNCSPSHVYILELTLREHNHHSNISYHIMESEFHCY